jgi:diguanylate cyclase (GGDEF)-like protein
MLQHIEIEVLKDYVSCLKTLLPGVSGFLFHSIDGQVVWQDENAEFPLFNDVYHIAIRQACQFGELPHEQRRIDIGGSKAFLFHLAADDGLTLGTMTVVFGQGKGDVRWEAVAERIGPAVRGLCREMSLRGRLRNSDEKQEDQIGNYEFLRNIEDALRSQERCEVALENILQQCQAGLGLDGTLFYAPGHKLVVTAGPNPVGLLEAELLFESLQDIVTDAYDNVAELLAQRPKPNPREPVAIWPVLENGSRLIGILALSRSSDAAQWSRHTDSLVRLVVSGLERILEREFDSLTGLGNWSSFEAQLKNACLALSNRSKILMFMDIDQLHVVNDTFGRDTGDTVLRGFADIVRNKLDGHILARISDDSFAVLLENWEVDAVEKAGQAICQAFHQTNYTRGSQSIRPSVSIGIAELEDGSKSVTDWLAHAQVACQAAKERGCGRVEIYQSCDASIIRRMDDIGLISSIRNAIDAGRLVLYAQPIVPIGRPDPVKYFELLVRLLDPHGQPVEPAEFMRTAERYQLIQDIDRWVVTKALESLASSENQRNDAGFRFAINLSGQSLGNDQFLGFIRGELARYKVSPSRLCFEITETVAVTNLGKAQILINELKKLGCQFSLDDFGTGMSSFAYLKLFPVDKVKIDGSFVHDICSNDVSRAMVTAITEIARVMRLETVAEYVQDSATLKRLQEIGVDWAQGFYTGAPRPLSELLDEAVAAKSSGASDNSRTRLTPLPA